MPTIVNSYRIGRVVLVIGRVVIGNKLSLFVVIDLVISCIMMALCVKADIPLCMYAYCLAPVSKNNLM